MKTTVGDAISGSQEALFNDVFTSGLASHVDSQDMESMMRSMMSSDPQLLTQFDQLHSVAHSQDTGTGTGRKLPRLSIVVLLLLIPERHITDLSTVLRRRF